MVAWLSCVRAVPTHSYSVPDQPVCLTMGDVMLGGTMGVVMLGSTWLAQYNDRKTKHRLLVPGRFDFTSNAARGIFYDCFGKGKHGTP